MHAITIKNYSHLGFSGELNIGFFNNRLMGTLFYSVDVEKYIASFNKTTDIKLNDNQEASLPPHTRIRVATDYQGHKKYIDWSDNRLDKEVNLWIERYS